MFCLTELGGLRYDMKRKSFAKDKILAQALANMESGIGLFECASRAAWLVCATPFLGFGIRPPSSEQLGYAAKAACLAFCSILYTYGISLSSTMIGHGSRGAESHGKVREIKENQTIHSFW